MEDVVIDRQRHDPSGREVAFYTPPDAGNLLRVSGLAQPLIMISLENKFFSSDIFSSAFLLGNIGAPFIIGLAVGYFAKKMLKIALLLGGATVVSLFAAEYYGIVHISDAELQNAASTATHAVKSSGDFLLQRLSSITTKGVSGAAGFFAGFRLG